MYATIVVCDMHNRTSAFAHGHADRTLAATLAALPGFVAFVSFEIDTATGAIATVCLVEERTTLVEAERVIARWQQAQVDEDGSGVWRLGAGVVIAQRGL